MASIFGMSLKSVKSFNDPNEGPVYQGNLYFGNKKIAFWSQDSNGGIEDIFCFENGYSESKLRDLVKKDFGGRLEDLMAMLLALTYDERQWKKFKKDGAPVCVMATDGYHQRWMSFRLPEGTRLTADDIKTECPDRYAALSKGMEDVEYYSFSKPSDFDFGDPYSLDDIKGGV